MTTFDFSPLFRSTIGFDRLARIMDSATRHEQSNTSYPPYNIERTDENNYRISMAVAGFAQDDLTIQSEQNTLTVIGKKIETKEQNEFLYQGIANRTFERKFQLADHVKVAQASLEHGMLHIDLVRELPETMKPRTIEILNNDNSSKLIEGKKTKKAAA